MGGPEPKQDKSSHHDRTQTTRDTAAPAKPGSTTRVGGLDPVAAHAQSLRIGKAALDRLHAALPQLTSAAPLPDAVRLDARRALRELDDAIEHTLDTPVLLDTALREQRARLVIGRRALPAEVVDRLGPRTTAARSAPPKLAFSPNSLTFPSVMRDTEHSMTVKITNRERHDVGLRDLVVPSGDFTAKIEDPWVLAPGESTTIEVVFAPKHTGPASAVIHVGTGGDAMAALHVAGTGGTRLHAPIPVTYDDHDRATIAVHTQHGVVPGRGADRTTLVSAEVIGGNGAYTAVVRQASVGPAPYVVGLVGLEFDETRRRGATSAVIRIKASDGDVIEVPVSAPRAERRALDVFPADVALPTKHAKRSPNGSISITPPDEPDGHERRITLHNRALKPVTITAIKNHDGRDRGFWVAGPKQGAPIVIAPGGSYALRVGSSPTEIGGKIDSFRVLGAHGEPLAGFLVHGDVQAEETEPPALVRADAKAPPTKDDPKALAAARDVAEDAVSAWASANSAVLLRSNQVLVGEWGTYLKYTSVNPGIPEALLPDSAVVKSLLSNAFGNFMSDYALKTLGIAASRAAEKAAAKVLSAVGATLMATGVGFIVGVLIETAAGLIFDHIVSEEKNEAARAYKRGESDGAMKTGEAAEHKNNEIARALTLTGAKAETQRKHIAALIKASTSVDDLKRMTAELGAVTAALGKAVPNKGAISHDLLALWVRGRAASTHGTTADTNDSLWRQAVVELSKKDARFLVTGGGLVNQPDLFVDQCAKEWQLWGLPMPPALKQTLLAQISPRDLADRTKADQIARRFQAQFDRKEFVWDDLAADQVESLADQLPKTAQLRRQPIDTVSATPILAVENGCCVVKKMLYQVHHRATNTRFLLRTAPGLNKLQLVSAGLGTELELQRPAEAQREATLYQVMTRLRAAGTHVEMLEGGRGRDWIRSRFGAEHTDTTAQHFSGRKDAVTVFRVTGGLHRPSGDHGPVVPGGDQGLYGPLHLEVVVRDDLAMLRGGNAILVVGQDMLPALGMRSTEPDPRNERMRKQRDDERVPR